MQLDLILVPYDSGHRARRLGAGPLHLVEAGLATRLEAHGHEVRTANIELDVAFSTEVAAAFALARGIAEQVRAARAAGRLPIILAGNCAAAIGAVTALRRPAVFWFDAHADLNTPDTTRSGFLDGMSLAIVLGNCWSALAADVGLEPVAQHRVCLLGARDLDPAERDFLTTAAVRRGSPATARAAIRALATGEEAYVHVDLDVLDPAVGRANQFAAPNGFTLPQLLAALDAIAESTNIAAVALTAYDPAYDEAGTIAAAAMAITEKVASLAAARARAAGDDPSRTPSASDLPAAHPGA